MCSTGPWRTNRSTKPSDPQRQTNQNVSPRQDSSIRGLPQCHNISHLAAVPLRPDVPFMAHLDLRDQPPQQAEGDCCLDGRSNAPFECRCFRWSRGGRVLPRLQALVEELDVSVEAGYLPSEVPVVPIRYCGCQGGSFGLEAGPAEHSSQLPRGLLVGFDLQRIAPLIFGRAGVDGPGLSPLPAPVPGEILDCLVDVVGDGLYVGGLAGTAHGDIAELSAAASA
jgi:hypothetical protein